MAAYANLHLAFEGMRVGALHHSQGFDPAIKSPPPGETDGTDPPRVLILGPENSGKTTVAKILISYATRAGQDWCPFLVNTDPGEVGVFLFS